MNQHQEPVHLNYCGRLDAIDPKQRIVFTLFLFILGFATSRKIYQKKSREIWDKQTLHLGHLLQVPTQLCRRELYPLDPLGALQSETTCLPCLPEAQQFLYKLQSSAIICNQATAARMLTPQKITMWIHFGSFQQVFEIHFGVSNSAHAPKHFSQLSLLCVAIVVQFPQGALELWGLRLRDCGGQT